MRSFHRSLNSAAVVFAVGVLLWGGFVGAEDGEDKAFFETCLKLEKDHDGRELAKTLAKANASQRGSYRYLYYLSVAQYDSGALEAGDVLAAATIHAIKADKRPAESQQAILDQVSNRLGAARKRALEVAAGSGGQRTGTFGGRFTGASLGVKGSFTGMIKDEVLSQEQLKALLGEAEIDRLQVPVGTDQQR